MDDLKAFGVPVLILSGGEPLLRPDIFDIAARAKAMGFYVGLSTNGTLIDEPISTHRRDRLRLCRHQPRRHQARPTTASAAGRAPSTPRCTGIGCAATPASRSACASP
jgi:MoaA/NifB/PqqE/SkfB family radical SAM enzyme